MKRGTSWKPQGFDPEPYLERLNVPAMWLFGGADRNVPPVQSVAALCSIKQKLGKDWTIVVYPGRATGSSTHRPPTRARPRPRKRGCAATCIRRSRL